VLPLRLVNTLDFFVLDQRVEAFRHELPATDLYSQRPYA